MKHSLNLALAAVVLLSLFAFAVTPLRASTIVVRMNDLDGASIVPNSLYSATVATGILPIG